LSRKLQWLVGKLNPSKRLNVLSAEDYLNVVSVMNVAGLAA